MIRLAMLFAAYLLLGHVLSGLPAWEWCAVVGAVAAADLASFFQGAKIGHERGYRAGRDAGDAAGYRRGWWAGYANGSCDEVERMRCKGGAPESISVSMHHHPYRPPAPKRTKED
ncbi:hypothetical protein WK07_04505 [Burkholderia multivorans]|uniref:hypothetical protein n=1 Tax=Burkholderia multivorans TaxID=87883 RepID=UPI00075A0674|nr:hypothetical protein [Burkholderia multivorans]KVQ85557.1 hypothetical protein WK07_04505 [Burkholderia multivorans]